MTAPIRSMPELVAALREWRDERGITHEVFDGIAGWPHGYAGKLLAPNPIKNLGWASLGLALDTLAIELVVIENPEQRKLVEGRWKRRERPKNGAASLICLKRQDVPTKQLQVNGFAPMQILGKAGGMASGKTRRKKAMRRRKLQRIRTHAARMRWSKNGKTT